MASEISTIQSLKAVDAWIDVINANINGGVRTAFKSSRLKFSGSNTDVSRAGNATSLPLQFPEPGLTTANSIIDFSQGAITASTENTHLAIQGEGFFVLANPAAIDATGQYINPPGGFLVTRDGEFRTNQNGLLVASNGWFLVTARSSGGFLITQDARAVYNNLDTTATAAALTSAVRLSDFVANAAFANTMTAANGNTFAVNGTGFSAANVVQSLVKVTLGKQSLQYSRYGSTVYDIGYQQATGKFGTTLTVEAATTADASILTKSLEASNASMTQSVPELSLAQKLFSALTKVLQTKQTNVDGVLNLVR